MYGNRTFNSRFYRRLWPVIILVTAGISLGVTDESDPILQYYWQQAARVAPGLDPAGSELSYSFTAISEVYQTDSRGAAHLTDSVVAQYFYTGSRLDSQMTTSGNSDRFSDSSFTCPNIFETAYHLNSFPNDTGGVVLAIGLIADSAESATPDGLLVIDRISYELRSLYLSFPDEKKYKRFTRSFEFEKIDGYIFPTLILEVGTRQGVFTRESYRMETRLTEIKVYY